MRESKYYNKRFFEMHLDAPYISAKELVPLINQTFKPSSVVDFGCGIGNWLKVWKEETAVDDLLGIEGPYIQEEFFKVSKEMIELMDLKNEIDLKRRFDLAISLEVAEHIPVSHAELFISNLVGASDVVVFSAAIVEQLGTYHINEQFPEYWAKIFKKFGYSAIDYFRPLIWNNEKIEYWYRQNILIFIKDDKIKNYPVLKPYYELTNPDYLLRIHPDQYKLKLDLIKKTSSFLGLARLKLYPLKLFIKRFFK